MAPRLIEITKNKQDYAINFERKKKNAIELTQEISIRINTEFYNLFIKLGCEGKNEFEYENLPCKRWKMNTSVKFRNIEKLEKLSSPRQTGWEKSVSTNLFQLALRKIDGAPFGLVEEINQGMDKYSEGLVLGMLFDISQKDENSQFLFISPKLVEGLIYNKTVNIIILFPDQSSEVKKALTI